MPRRLPKYVNAFSNKQRTNQTVRYVFRRKGQKSIVLPGPFLSAAFNAAYAAALGVPLPIGAGKTGPGTLDALIVTFYGSTFWTETLTDASRQTYRPIIERLRAEYGPGTVATLRPEHVAAMLEKIAKPSARKKLLKVLRMLMTAAIPSLRRDDPTLSLKVSLPQSKGHHSWSDQRSSSTAPISARHRGAAGDGIRPRTTSRRTEVARLSPQHVKDGWLKIERCHRSANVEILITPTLQAAIDAMPAVGIRTYVVGKRGGSLTPDAVAGEFAKWATEAGLPAHCRLHGLKKGGMRRIAETGASTHELRSISGHKTLAMIQHYTDAVDQKKLAAAAYTKITKATA